MQFESIEPVHRTFTSLSYPFENLVIENTFVVTSTDFGAAYKTDTGALSKTTNIQE